MSPISRSFTPFTTSFTCHPLRFHHTFRRPSVVLYTPQSKDVLRHTPFTTSCTCHPLRFHHKFRRSASNNVAHQSLLYTFPQSKDVPRHTPFTISSICHLLRFHHTFRCRTYNIADLLLCTTPLIESRPDVRTHLQVILFIFTLVRSVNVHAIGDCAHSIADQSISISPLIEGRAENTIHDLPHRTPSFSQRILYLHPTWSLCSRHVATGR
jgi:hypothetical protein